MSQFIKKLIPQPLYKKIKQLKARFHQQLIPLFSKTPFLARFYFSWFNTSYKREQYANLQGMQAYKKRIFEKSNASNPMLRRNIHRLEKGLIMKPLKSVFALDYIEETQQVFVLALQSTIHDKLEIEWSTAVLAKYYQTVDIKDNALLAKLAEQFYQVVDSQSLVIGPFTPYENRALKKPQLTYPEFYQFIQTRRSSRWFKQTHVCRDKISKAVTLASQAPSACNRQPYQFYVIDKEPLLSSISKLAIGGGGFAQNIPSLVVIVGDYSCYEHERDRHVIYIDASLAAMQFMQALPTLGLASCPMNWPELSVVDNKIAKFLQLAPYQKTIMLIAVGEAEADGGIPYSQKKTAEQLLKFID